MVLEDDRTKAEMNTHPVVVMMTDRFLSGWGKAENGTSYAGWACRVGDIDSVERWVRSRGDAMRVRIVGRDYHPPSISGHCHIYVVGADHPATR